MEIMNKLKILGMGMALVLSSFGSVFGATLVWDSVSSAEGYRVYWGTSLGNYPESRDVGSSTRYNLDSLPLADDTTYYFSVTAYNSAGESGYATPVRYSPGDNTPPLPPQSVWVQ